MSCYYFLFLAMCIIINNEEFPESEELSRRHRSYIDSGKT